MTCFAALFVLQVLLIAMPDRLTAIVPELPLYVHAAIGVYCAVHYVVASLLWNKSLIVAA